MKNLVFVLTAFVFVSFLFSACADGNSACVDSENIRVCENGGWIEYKCGLGCTAGECKVCRSGETKCTGLREYSLCDDGLWSSSRSCGSNMVCHDGGCYMEGYSPDDCRYVNDMQCYTDSKNVSVMQKCNKTKKWVNTSQCPLGCYGTSSCKDCDYGEEDAECLSNISFRECLRNYSWSEQTFCQSDYKCAEGRCVKTDFCEIGKIKCVNNSRYECFEREGWILKEHCYSKECKDTVEGPLCIDVNSTCFGWSEYVQTNTEEILETDQMGRERDCMNNTMERNCIDYMGEKNLQIKDVKYEYVCSGWSEICNMELERTEQYIRMQENMCAQCEDDVYVLKCESGKTYEKNSTRETFCTEWYECKNPAEAEQLGFIEGILGWIASLFG